LQFAGTSTPGDQARESASITRGQKEEEKNAERKKIKEKSLPQMTQHALVTILPLASSMAEMDERIIMKGGERTLIVMRACILANFLKDQIAYLKRERTFT